MTTEATNPFQLVYDELWSMLNEDVRFKVKEGNKIRFDDRNRQPLKTQMSSADYPEVMLVSEGTSGNLCNTSSTSQLRRNFSWVISSGDFRYNEIFPVEWAIFTGMLSWRERLSVLKWEDVLFVKNVNIIDSNFGQVEEQRRRGIEGWVAVWSIFVDMHFPTELLRGCQLADLT